MGLRNLILAAMMAGPAAAQAPVVFDAGTVSGLTARNIGSAEMSGRVAAVAAIVENGRLLVFAGSASGGVWKSVNGGTTFKPVFDSPDVQSIGAVAIDPSNPKNVWAGTGESWVRNSVSIGDGVYRSTDGGENWSNTGLKDSEHIAKILVDPRNSQVVFVAAQGPLWKEGGDRGLYKSSDGGKTWKAVLTVDPHTGVTDLVMDPRNPDVLYAATYQRRRHVWGMLDGGPGCGISHVPSDKRCARGRRRVSGLWPALRDCLREGCLASL